MSDPDNQPSGDFTTGFKYSVVTGLLVVGVAVPVLAGWAFDRLFLHPICHEEFPSDINLLGRLFLYGIVGFLVLLALAAVYLFLSYLCKSVRGLLPIHNVAQTLAYGAAFILCLVASWYLLPFSKPTANRYEYKVDDYLSVFDRATGDYFLMGTNGSISKVNLTTGTVTNFTLRRSP